MADMTHILFSSVWLAYVGRKSWGRGNIRDTNASLARRPTVDLHPCVVNGVVSDRKAVDQGPERPS